MTLGIAGIVTAYILIALLLLNLALYSNWSWQVKAIGIVLTSVFYIVTYLSFPPLLGWATTQSPVKQFRLIAAHVTEPNKEFETDGSIYLWLSEFKNRHAVSPPRAHELPYTNEMHEMVIKANAKLDQNIEQLGEFKELDTEQLMELKEGTRTTQVSTKVEFYDMPDPLFPEK